MDEMNSKQSIQWSECVCKDCQSGMNINQTRLIHYIAVYTFFHVSVADFKVHFKYSYGLFLLCGSYLLFRFS